LNHLLRARTVGRARGLATTRQAKLCPLSAIEQTEPTRPFEAVGISARIRYWRIARWPSRATGPFVHSGRRSAGAGLSGIAGERLTRASVVLVRWVQTRRRWPLTALPCPHRAAGASSRDRACCWFGGCIERTGHTGNLDIGARRDRPRSAARSRGCRFARAVRGARPSRGFFSCRHCARNGAPSNSPIHLV